MPLWERQKVQALLHENVTEHGSMNFDLHIGIDYSGRETPISRTLSRLEDNPLVWVLQVNGLMMDVRQAPREVQEIAFRKGLIPYVPADRKQGE